MKQIYYSIITLISLFSCTKDIAKNPALAYSDKALYDSITNTSAFVYYKNNLSVIYPGTNGPHGAFKLRFNQTANAVLTDYGKLPVGQKFPEGSMIVKEIQSNGDFAFMYKRNGTWLWGESTSKGSTIFSVNKDPGVACISCHSQTGQRDLVVSFQFY